MSFRRFSTVVRYVLLALGIVTMPAVAQIQFTPTMDTIAGTGTQGNTGDGGPGIAAEVTPGVRFAATDRQGNFYYADLTEMLVRRVDARTGIITTIAGTPATNCNYTTSTCGDGGPATSSTLKVPSGVAVDAAGNVYIADSSDARVRVVNGITGIITTFAGGGTAPTTCTGNMSSTIGDGCQATAATLSSPVDIAFDSRGNLYISDAGSRRIREVNIATNVITTYAGVGAATTCAAGTSPCGDGGAATAAAFILPQGIAFDANDNLYVCDGTTYRVRMILSATVGGVVHPVSTIAGTGTKYASGSYGDGGPGTNANLLNPYGVAVDSAGNVYFADEGTDIVQELPALSPGASPTFGNMVNYAGAGGISSAPLGDGSLPPTVFIHAPFGLAIDPFNVMSFTNANSIRVRGVALSPVFQQTNVAATTGTLLTLDSVVVPAAGDKLASMSIPAQAADFKLAASSCATNTALAAGTLCAAPVTFLPKYPGQRTAPLTAVDGAGTKSTVGLQGFAAAPFLVFSPGTISSLAGTGTAGSAGDGGLASAAQLSDATSSAVDALGNVYIADTANNAIRLISATTGDISTFYSTGLRSPKGVAVDAAGNVYIADTGNHVIRVINGASGAASILAGTSGTSGYSGDGKAGTSATLNAPSGLSIDVYGALYIADTGNNVVRTLNLASGIITTVAGTGTSGSSGDDGAATKALLNRPEGVAFVSPPAIQSNGMTSAQLAPQLLIADTANNKIREVNLVTGTISTVAGNGSSGYTGDGASATTAELAAPASVASDAAGDIYIADSGNHVVREVSVAKGFISTVAGSGSHGDSGDGSSALLATLTTPSGITTDGTGSLYITDSGVSALRKDIIASGTLSFGQVYVNNTATLAVTALNSGNSGTPLTFSSITSPAGFTYLTPSGGDCTAAQTLAPGASCTMRFSFAPTIAGTVSGNLAVRTNSLFGTTTSTVALIGIGTQASSSVNVSFSPASPVYEQATSAVISVTGTGTATPSGSVTVSIDNGSASAPIALVGGSVTYSLPLLTAGTHSITVAYLGDSGFLPSSNTVSLTIGKETPPIAWTPLATSQTFGTAIGSGVLDASSVPGTISYTATASGGSPVLITASTVLQVGTYTIIATLTPTDQVDYTSATAQITYTVTNVAATISVSASSSTVSVGTAVVLTATVQINSADAIKGQVFFFDGSHFLSKMQVISASDPSTEAVAGTAVLHVALTSGTHSITAQYVGSYGVSSPVSNPTSVNVTGKSPTTATLTEATDPTNTLNYDFTLSVAGNGYPGPSGTASLVDVTAGGSTIGSFPLSGSTLTPGATHNAAVTLPISPTFGVSADLNNDGIKDVVAIDSTTNKVALLLGGSTTPTTLTLASGHLPTSVLAGDFNGDGIPDLIFVGSGWMDVYLGNGGGTFTVGSSYSFTGNAVSVAGGDFNQDGYLDVAVALSNGSVAVFNGLGNGSFSSNPTVYTTGQTSAAAIAAASLSATTSGPLSLIVGGSSLSVLLNPGDGSGALMLSQTVALTAPATSVAVADFNGDGANDVIVANGTTAAQLLLNNGSGTLGAPTVLTLPSSFTQLQVLDLDGDGVADLSGVSQSGSGADSLTVLLGKGDGTFTNSLPLANLGTNAVPAIALPVDLNGDGILDFAVLSGGSSTVETFYTESVATGTIVNTAVNGSGVHALDAQFPGDVNYNASTSNSVNVNTRSVSTPTLSWAPSTTTVVYGTALSASILDASATSAGNSVPGTYVYTATPTGGTGQVVTSGTVLPVGTYNLSVAFSPTDNVSYNPVSGSINFIVTSASATITIANATKVYGAALPTFSATVAGLVNGDALGATVLVTFATTATQASGVGGYPIIGAVSGTASGNYIFNVVPGTLTVTAAPATLTVADASKIYGAALPTLSASATGLVNGDTLGTTIIATLSTSAIQSSSVGTYPITAVMSGTSYKNYSFTVNPGTLTITPAAATVTTANASKAYGAALPTFTATVTGLVNGDTYGTTILANLFSTATATSNVGTYPISATMSGSSARDYTFTYSTGTLTITSVPLTINIANVSSSYGGVPNFSATATGLVNGDTLGTTIIVNYSSAGALPTATPGPYTITATLSGTSANDYTATINPGTLTITAADALVALTASPTVSPVGAAVVLTAMVTSATSGVPTGAVVFYDGATSLGSGTLTAGKATLSVTTLPLGSDSITAAYQGSTDFYSATSTAQIVTVVVPEFTITPTGSSAVSILPGGSASYNFAFTPQAPETVFGAAITLAVSGLPSNASYTFTPTTIAAGAPQTNVSLIVSVPNAVLSQTGALRATGSTQRFLAGGLAAFLLLPLAIYKRKARKQLRDTLRLGLLLVLGAAVLGGISGCGAPASGVFDPSPKTYTLTISGTSSTSIQYANVTLTVQ